MQLPDESDADLSTVPTQRLIDTLIQRHDCIVVVGYKRGGAKPDDIIVRMGQGFRNDLKCDPRCALVLMGKAQVAIASALPDPNE